MNIQLDQQERDLLVEEIENIIPELSGIIASGVRKELRDEMNKEKEMLIAILEKLKKAA